MQVGLGKTLASALAADELKAGNILVIMPQNLRPQWIKELKKYFPSRPAAESTTPDGIPVLTIGNQAYTFTYYQQYRNAHKLKTPALVTGWLLEQEWDLVIIDEVHRLSRDARWSYWIKHLRTPRKIGLTGTPIADKPDQLWSLLNWVAPNKFNNYWSFVSAYMEVEHGRIVGVKQVIDPATQRHTQEPVLRMLREQTKQFILTYRLEDVGLQLPPLTINTITLGMGEQQAKHYAEVQRQLIIELKEEGIKFGPYADYVDLTSSSADKLIISTAGARFTRLHQVASLASYFKPSVKNDAKISWLRNYVEEGGAPALILTRYNLTADTIKAELMALGATGFIVGTWAALSTGHNFQHLTKEIHWDSTYARLEYEQGIGRIYRSGQVNPTEVIRLQLAGTIDERVGRMIDNKDRIANVVIEWLRGLHE